jgi:hypothetical protein
MSTTGGGQQIDDCRADPLFTFLERRILMLFKTVSYYPYIKKEDINHACRKILGYDFPVMHHFFEKIDSLICV